MHEDIEEDMLPRFEVRPFIEGKQLCVACSLCGGKTLDIWVNFLTSVVREFGAQDISPDAITQSIYEYLISLEEESTEIKVEPYFYASRENPTQRASIAHLGYKNFTIKDMSIAMIESIVDELYAFWIQVPEFIKQEKHHIYLTGGSTKLPIITSYVRHMFDGLTIQSLASGQETALGAALWCFRKYYAGGEQV